MQLSGVICPCPAHALAGRFSGYERYTVLKPHDLKMSARVFISECVMKTPHNEVGEPCCRLRGNRGYKLLTPPTPLVLNSGH